MQARKCGRVCLLNRSNSVFAGGSVRGRKPTAKFSLSLPIERHCPQEEWP